MHGRRRHRWSSSRPPGTHGVQRGQVRAAGVGEGALDHAERAENVATEGAGCLAGEHLHAPDIGAHVVRELGGEVREHDLIGCRHASP